MSGLATREGEGLDAVELEQVRAVADILRGIIRTAAAGAVAGIVVAGIGGRVVMRLATALNPQAVGASTENGNVIGDITLSGTMALLGFGGLFSGLIGAAVWTAVAEWIPGRGVRRALLAAPIAVALAGFFIVQSDNRDFLVLRSDYLIIGMLLGIVAAFGFCLALLDEWLDRRLPRPGANPRSYALGALFLVLFGVVLVLPITIGFYFSDPACLCTIAPVPLAVPLIVAGVATVTSWAQGVLGRTRTAALVRLVGRLGLLASVALGATILVKEIAAIPA